jgi:hypothetical protein
MSMMEKGKDSVGLFVVFSAVHMNFFSLRIMALI